MLGNFFHHAVELYIKMALRPTHPRTKLKALGHRLVHALGLPGEFPRWELVVNNQTKQTVLERAHALRPFRI